MKTSNLYQPTLSFGLLLKGMPKTGKTTLAMMFPNVYVADCDNNLGGAIRMLRKLWPEKEFRYDTINVADDGTLVPDEKRWERLVECCKAAARDPWVKTIVVDSAASIDQYLQNHILATKEKEKDRMTWGDWVPYRNLLTKFITAFRSCNKYFIMTAHEITEKDDVSGSWRYKVSVSSKLQDNFGGFFSDEWICRAEEQMGKMIYSVSSTPEPMRSAGSSLGDLLPIGPWVFDWNKFAQRLQSFNEELKGKQV